MRPALTKSFSELRNINNLDKIEFLTNVATTVSLLLNRSKGAELICNQALGREIFLYRKNTTSYFLQTNVTVCLVKANAIERMIVTTLSNVFHAENLIRRLIPFHG